jgi:hypothetical protein
MDATLVYASSSHAEAVDTIRLVFRRSDTKRRLDPGVLWLVAVAIFPSSGFSRRYPNGGVMNTGGSLVGNQHLLRGQDFSLLPIFHDIRPFFEVY